VTRWRLEVGSEKATLKSALLKILVELDVDLQDMDETVQIAGKDPEKFGLDKAELQHRRDFVQTSLSQTMEVRMELTGETTPAKGRREAAERIGLLASPSATPSAHLDLEMQTAPSARQNKAHQLNEEMIQEQQTAQQTALQDQDEQLGALSGVMTRLGNMGRAIHEELISQGKALDEFTAEVDETQGRMRQAISVMQKMLKNKENGKFCAILVLSIVLIILMFLVFS